MKITVFTLALITLISMGFALFFPHPAAARDNFINQPKPLVVKAAFESTGRTTLVAAGADISIKNLQRLPDGRRVRLNGTIEAMQSNHEFMLRDGTGRIEVVLPSNHGLKLAKGADVTVAGRINRGIMGVNIEANSVVGNTRSTQASYKKEKPVKNIVLTKATSYNIANLPETGLVKVSGTVTTSQNDEQFILKDTTGLVDIVVTEADASKVAKGSRVTVIGFVDRGVLGKDISASTITLEKHSQMASAE